MPKTGPKVIPTPRAHLLAVARKMVGPPECRLREAARAVAESAAVQKWRVDAQVRGGPVALVKRLERGFRQESESLQAEARRLADARARVERIDFRSIRSGAAGGTAHRFGSTFDDGKAAALEAIAKLEQERTAMLDYLTKEEQRRKAVEALLAEGKIAEAAQLEARHFAGGFTFTDALRWRP